MDQATAIRFLEDAAEYFERRDTKGEDKAHWANVYNANNRREIQNLIGGLRAENERLEKLANEYLAKIAKEGSTAARMAIEWKERATQAEAGIDRAKKESIAACDAHMQTVRRAEAAEAQAAAMVGALVYYDHLFCEGWCKENGGTFDACGGCPAKTALATLPTRAADLLAVVEAARKGRASDSIQCTENLQGGLSTVRLMFNSLSEAIAFTEALAKIDGTEPVAQYGQETGMEKRT